jgi:hypothetical protein
MNSLPQGAVVENLLDSSVSTTINAVKEKATALFQQVAELREAGFFIMTWLTV